MAVWITETEALCEPCRREALVCVLCGRALERAFVRLDGALMLSHPQCAESCDRCDVCGRTWPPAHSAQLPDGRSQCTYCRQTAIVTDEQVLRLVPAARRFVERSTGIRLRTSARTRVASPAEIERMLAGARKRPEHDSSGRFVGAFMREDDGTIVVESGWPEDEAVGILVHEFGHALVAQQGWTLDLVAEEGYCAWLEHEYWGTRGRPARQSALLQRSGPYGTGLRSALVAYTERRLSHQIQMKSDSRRA